MRVPRDPCTRTVRPPAPSPFPASPGDGKALRRIAEILRGRTGFDLALFRERCAARRIRARMRARGAPDLSSYVPLLEADRDEVEELLSAITIDVSEFFRNPSLFRTLRHLVLPGLFGRASRAGRPRLLLWSAGAGRGEEAWSLALIARESEREFRLSRGGVGPGFRVCATDIDPRSLEAARAGIYGTERLRHVPPEIRAEGLGEMGDGRWSVAPGLRRRVRFRRENLADPPSVRGADLVLCRNVLIYLAPGLQERVLVHLHGALRPGGVLVLGRVERLSGPARDLFATLDPHERIFVRPGGEPPCDAS